jgi:predicted  nucleic acid-binding Zn-ribbon protein
MIDEQDLPEDQPESAPEEEETDDGNKEIDDLEPEPVEKTKEQKRIDKLVYEKYTARQQAEDAKREANELRQRLNDLNMNGSAATNDGDIQQLIQLEARKLAAEESFNSTCNKIYEKGIKNIPGFEKAVSNLQMIGVSRDFLELIADSDEPQKLLAHFGNDIDAAEELLSMTPTKMAKEIAKVEIKLANTKKQISNAPTPIKSIASTGNKGNVPRSDMSDADYAKWRKLGR